MAWVVLGILAFTIFWNFGVTQSTGNVTRFAEQAAERGPEFLPSSQGRSLLIRWLQGNAPHKISGERYAERVGLIYDATAPWLNSYPKTITDEYPVHNADVPKLVGPLPAAGALNSVLLIVVSQGLVIVTALGMIVFAWRRRRDFGTSARELALLGFVILAFVGIHARQWCRSRGVQPGARPDPCVGRARRRSRHGAGVGSLRGGGR